MKKILLPFLFFTPFLVFAQIGGNSVGARSFGVAGNTTQLKDLWSIENNPAALAFVKERQVGMAYESAFLLKELSSRNILLSNPLIDGTLGFILKQFGYHAFNQNKIGVSYGLPLGENFSMGVQISYLNTRIKDDYGNRNSISGNVGLLTNITKDITLAFTLVNLSRTKLATHDDERYPTLFNLGVSYQFSEKAVLLTQITKDAALLASLKTGVEYQIDQLFYIRLGYATQPSSSSFGFACKLKRLQIDVASSLDFQIGLSSQLSITYFPNRSQE